MSDCDEEYKGYYGHKRDVFRCVICGDQFNDPRQLCRKSYCPKQFEDDYDDDDDNDGSADNEESCNNESKMTDD